jgi:acyl carrier protein
MTQDAMLHERLEEVFRDIFDDDTIVLSDRTITTDIDGWDSLSHINLMVSIEETFGVQFSGNELAEFENVGELKQFLARRARV